MQDIILNYWAILSCAVLAMVVGSIWYGPMFGKKWMEVVGADKIDMERRAEMMKGVWKLYITQFVLALFQIWVLAIYIVTAEGNISDMENTLWIWAAFVMPTIAGSAMWNNDSAKVSWMRFLIQSGYQLICFVIFALVLTSWR